MARMASSDWLTTARVELIVLEHVTGDDDELGSGLGGHRTQARDDITPGGRVARLRLARQEVPRHAELPIGCVDEPHPASPVRGSRFLVVASLGPRTDKFGDLTRHVALPCSMRMSTERRTLVLLRHAKSDYPGGVADHDRPLAPRGEREAGLAGEWLRSGVIDPPVARGVVLDGHPHAANPGAHRH